MTDVKNKKAELRSKTSYGFEDLVTVMEVLRSEEGCPWDREQTHESIRNNFIEETYEVIEAIDTNDPVLLREELGDVMLQVVFHARMEEENGGFSINDLILPTRRAFAQSSTRSSLRSTRRSQAAIWRI